MKHRTTEFAIDYLGSDGQKRGHEACVLTTHGNGHMTLRARCEIFDSEVLRDVVYTVDDAFRPVDASIRVSVQDRFVGTGWFRFSPAMAEGESFTAAEGRVSQRIALDTPAASFLTHAVSADVWHGAGIKRQMGLGPQPIAPLLSSSPLHNGSTGPLLGYWPLRAHYLGQEPVDVPAGRFDAEHIRYEEPDGALFLDTWCTADAERIMLKMYYPPYRSSYLLTALRR